MNRTQEGASLVLALLLTACSGGDSASAVGSVARDSLGVRIVENSQQQGSTWTAEPEPLFALGWNSGDPTFTWLQAGRILPNGGALVGDFGSGVIYQVDPDGSVVTSWGRKGEGPGEFQAFDAILHTGDSILVSDGRLQRLTVLSSDGAVLATHRQAGAFVHRASALLDDGRLLVTPGEGYSGLSETRPEWIFETQPVLAVGLESATVDTLAELPHLRRWLGTRGGSPGPIVVKGRAGGYSEGFAWARADRPEVQWYDTSGNLVQVARWEEDPLPLTADRMTDISNVFEESFRAGGADEAFITAQLLELEAGFDRYEGPLPYWDALYVDREGNTWLSEYALPGQLPTRWRVVTRSGEFVGWVELPDVAEILDITEDHILAVSLDELEVPALVMLELSR